MWSRDPALVLLSAEPAPPVKGGQAIWHQNNDVPEPVLLFLTCASLGEGEAISRRLLELRLIACATLGSHVRSYYTWKGEKQETTEYPLVLKSHREHLPAIEAEVRRLHSYEVPELIAVPIVGGSADYLAWVAESLAPAG